MALMNPLTQTEVCIVQFLKQKNKTMQDFNIPTRDEVSENNQQIFDNLKKMVGFVPNLYATYAYNETALGDYLALWNWYFT